MFVCDFVFILFRITLWLSAGTELFPWLSACVLVLFHAVSILCVPFPLGVLDRMWNSMIVSVSGAAVSSV